MISNFNTKKWQLIFDDEFMSLLDCIVSCRIPGLDISYTELPIGKGLRLKIAGDTATWDELPISFVVDDLMKNYEKFKDWLERIYDPFEGTQSFDEAKAATINICRDSGLVRRKIQFTNIFPITLSGIDLVTNDQGEQFEVATVTLVHQGWKFKPINQ